MIKIKKLTMFVFLCLVMLFLASCGNKEEDGTRSYISVEINPAVEIVLNGDDEVVTVNGLNDDGEMLITDEKMVGKSVNDFLQIII